MITKETYEKIKTSPVLRHILATKSPWLPNMSLAYREVLKELALACGLVVRESPSSPCGPCWYEYAKRVCAFYVDYENKNAEVVEKDIAEAKALQKGEKKTTAKKATKKRVKKDADAIK